MNVNNAISFLGFFALLAFTWLLSENRKVLNRKVVLWGIGLQLFIGVFVFVMPAGMKFFLFLNDAVLQLLEAATAGGKFVFGRLALPPGESGPAGEESLGFILAFQGFPTIIFFSALVSVLYFCNIMPWVIRGFAYIFTGLMKISGMESLVAASNIFVGIESALTVKPFLRDMTRSEACTMLALGMSTVSSNVLALYVMTLKDQFPTIAAHLISASLLSAPAALVTSKLLVPEQEHPVTLGRHIHPYYKKEDSLFEAVMSGAQSGIQMIVGIVALLIAVLGLVALVDLGLGAFGNAFNAVFHANLSWSLSGLLGYIFYPFTLLLGVPWQDAGAVAKIIGERAIVTEVVAYQDLASSIILGRIAHPRSVVIATYALCGFAHLASMSIFVGGFSALVREKRGLLASVSWRALLAATLACLLTACVAGMFYTDQTIILLEGGCDC